MLFERHLDVAPLAMWGGLECSVVRIGDSWRDQVAETGHHDRIDDLDRVAALGIRTLRYPLLLERRRQDPDWAWHDGRLERLRNLGIAPVAGLLHHGMGVGGGLLHPDFPHELARHAAAVAERYPDIALWTPVNEPLTTARFACLYGHWHPHLQDEGGFVRAVAAQCYAVLLAMRAVRSHAPAARFMHTEDLGRVYATAPVAAQAAYENQRRWLSLDLLCGRVDRYHLWRAMFERHGVAASQLDELATGEAAPDLIGINHYVTSDRFLDHRLELYPQAMHGGNGRQAYVDTEAVRIDLRDVTGWQACLQEAWQRYRVPLVLSEVHLGCEDVQEQVRWLVEAWNVANGLRGQGVDIRALTAWALFGLVDWDSLLRQRHGRYEPGAYDIRTVPPTSTLLAQAIATLAQDGEFSHPALAMPGWWRRSTRLHHQQRLTSAA